MNTIQSNKKGISAIVATVLIILITVAAVTIIWAAIIPLVSNQLDKGTACLDATQTLTLPNNGYTCTSSSNTSFQIKRGGNDAGIIGILISVEGSDGSSVTASLNNSGNYPNKTVLSKLDGTAITSFIGPNEQITVVSNQSNARSITVAPFIKIKNKVITCDTAATIEPPTCA